VTCTFASVALNARVSVLIAVRPLVVGSITNNAIVTSAATDPDPANNSTSLVTTVLPAADLAVSKSASPGIAITTSNLTFNLVVTNAGPSTATNVVLSDPLPPVFTLLSVPPACTVSNGVIICNLGDLTNGGTTTVNLPVTATTVGIFTNIATVASTGPQGVADLVPNNNSASAVAVINDFPGMPTLRVARVGANVVLSWSTNSLAGRLQTKSALDTNVAWTDLTYSHVAVGNQFKFTNAITGSAKFFRLAQ